MAEDAKKSVDESAEKKGRAEDKPKTPESSEQNSDDSQKDAKFENSKAEQSEKVEDDTSEVAKPEDSESSEDKDIKDNSADEKDNEAKSSNQKEAKNSSQEEFQAEVREQIENCKFEIISSLQENIHKELSHAYDKQVRKIEKRRRTGFIVRDIFILILAALVGYFGYCLYDAEYFDFFKPNCEIIEGNKDNQCDGSGIIVTPTEPEVVKDTAWYQKNYGYLLDGIKLKLDADKIDSYYLYSGDYKVSEIQTSYLLGMAFNHLEPSAAYDTSEGIVIPAGDLRAAFVNLFGSAASYSKRDFTYDCTNFTYNANLDAFVTPSVLCTHNGNRQIIEQVDEIYEEGNVMYFLTTATIFDRKSESFYTFDNLFKSVVTNVSENDLAKHVSLLNHYQYQFKKVDDNYYFSGVVKLK